MSLEDISMAAGVFMLPSLGVNERLDLFQNTGMRDRSQLFSVQFLVVSPAGHIPAKKIVEISGWR
jgi:hypothetical protein